MLDTSSKMTILNFKEMKKEVRERQRKIADSM